MDKLPGFDSGDNVVEAALSARGGVFPIIEIFGYEVGNTSPEAVAAQSAKLCPFAGGSCEKFRQYGFGYCSVTYAAADDKRTMRTYAVCDHRLDGDPIRFALRDAFGDQTDNIDLVPEVQLVNPKMSFDYVALHRNDTTQMIAIETQAIDLRGGGVGPAFKAWQDGRTSEWRRYFTEEAATKSRRDTVAYGVNMANVYKRIGLQIAVKGQFLDSIGVPLYVVMQERPFAYLRSRVVFEEAKNLPNLVFMTFDYPASADGTGMFKLQHVRTVRTTVAEYALALMQANVHTSTDREAFLERVRQKAQLT